MVFDVEKGTVRCLTSQSLAKVNEPSKNYVVSIRRQFHFKLSLLIVRTLGGQLAADQWKWC